MQYQFINKNLLRYEHQPDMCGEPGTLLGLFVFEEGLIIVKNPKDEDKFLEGIKTLYGHDATAVVNHHEGGLGIYFSNNCDIHYPEGIVIERDSCEKAWAQYYLDRENCLTTAKIPEFCKCPL